MVCDARYLVVLAEGAGGGVLLLMVRAGPAAVHNHLLHQEPFPLRGFRCYPPTPSPRQCLSFLQLKMIRHRNHHFCCNFSPTGLILIGLSHTSFLFPVKADVYGDQGSQETYYMDQLLSTTIYSTRNHSHSWLLDINCLPPYMFFS